MLLAYAVCEVNWVCRKQSGWFTSVIHLQRLLWFSRWSKKPISVLTIPSSLLIFFIKYPSTNIIPCDLNLGTGNPVPNTKISYAILVSFVSFLLFTPMKENQVISRHFHWVQIIVFTAVCLSGCWQWKLSIEPFHSNLPPSIIPLYCFALSLLTASVFWFGSRYVSLKPLICCISLFLLVCPYLCIYSYF